MIKILRYKRKQKNGSSYTVDAQLEKVMEEYAELWNEVVMNPHHTEKIVDEALDLIMATFGLIEIAEPDVKKIYDIAKEHEAKIAIYEIARQWESTGNIEVILKGW